MPNYKPSSGSMTLSNFTFTRTTVTTTSTSLVTLLDKTAGGGMLYTFVVEDLDSSGNTDQIKIADIDGVADFNTQVRAVDTIGQVDVQNQMSDAVTTNYIPGANLNSNVPIYFDTSLKLQIASHSSPSTGLRGTVIYGDPNGTGHVLEGGNYRKRFKINKKIDEYLILELKQLLPDIDTIRQNWGRENNSIDIECNQTKKSLNNLTAQIEQKITTHQLRPKREIINNKYTSRAKL